MNRIDRSRVYFSTSEVEDILQLLSRINPKDLSGLTSADLALIYKAKSVFQDLGNGTEYMRPVSIR
jgi:hypothetical protein